MRARSLPLSLSLLPLWACQAEPPIAAERGVSVTMEDSGLEIRSRDFHGAIRFEQQDRQSQLPSPPSTLDVDVVPLTVDSSEIGLWVRAEFEEGDPVEGLYRFTPAEERDARSDDPWVVRVWGSEDYDLGDAWTVQLADLDDDGRHEMVVIHGEDAEPSVLALAWSERQQRYVPSPKTQARSEGMFGGNRAVRRSEILDAAKAAMFDGSGITAEIVLTCDDWANDDPPVAVGTQVVCRARVGGIGRIAVYDWATKKIVGDRQVEGAVYTDRPMKDGDAASYDWDLSGRVRGLSVQWQDDQGAQWVQVFPWNGKEIGAPTEPLPFDSRLAQDLVVGHAKKPGAAGGTEFVPIVRVVDRK